jgi:hypothetical protein
MSLGSSMLIKGLISAGVVTVLLLLNRGSLLKLLSLAMLVICAWNGLAVWFWG